MSQPSLVDPTGKSHAPVQKQKTNVYTVMLIISFICIVTACILLYIELTRWGEFPWWNTSGATPNTSAHYVVPDAPTPFFAERA